MPRPQLPLIANVASESEPGKLWPVKARDGELTCSCPRWIFNKDRPRSCRHTDEVHDQLRAERMTVDQAARLALVAPGHMSLVPPTPPDPIAVDLAEFRRRWSSVPSVFHDVEALVRKHAGRQSTPSQQPVGTRPAWLGGSRAIILRD